MDESILQKTLSLAIALLTGQDVGKDRMLKRLEICSKCDKVKHDGKLLRCGICGCKLKGDRSLINLTRYEETDRSGCKYPGGSKWKKFGV